MKIGRPKAAYLDTVRCGRVTRMNKQRYDEKLTTQFRTFRTPWLGVCLKSSKGAIYILLYLLLRLHAS